MCAIWGDLGPDGYTNCSVAAQIDPKKRPSFDEICSNLEEEKSRSQFGIVLADISKLNMGSDEVMNRTILEKILGE